MMLPISRQHPRQPERTLFYQTIAEHFETWYELASAGQFDGQGDHHTPKPYVRQAFRKYLECGIFAHGFARARCDDCGHDYFVAFSCKAGESGSMRIIVFITHSADIRRILDRIGVESEPPHIAPTRGPPLWEDCGDVQQGEGTQIWPDWELAAQPASD
jgi:Transposase zinc-binding domain